MLVITRKEAQSFFIGDDIQVVVLGVRGNQVRIGIDAPESMSILRDNIIKKIALREMKTEKENS